MSSGITSESVKALFDATANALKTCVITGQKTLGQALVTKLELLTRERNAVAHGYDQVVNRTDLEAWVIDIATQAKEKKKWTGCESFRKLRRFSRPVLRCGYILYLFEIFLKFRNNGCKLSANSL